MLARRRVGAQRGTREAPPPQRARERAAALRLDRAAHQPDLGCALQRGAPPLRLVPLPLGLGTVG